MEPDINMTEGDGESELTITTMYEMMNIVNRYGFPVLLALGTLGNCLCMGTLRSDKFRLTSMGFLLSALAFSDLLALYTGALRRWVDAAFLLDVRTVSNAACKIHTFFTYYSIHLSAWTLVLITLERLVAVTAPKSFNIICSRQRMMLAWFIIAVIILVLNSYILDKVELLEMVDTGSRKINCSSVGYSSCCTIKGGATHFLQTYMYWSDFFISCLLPTSFILCGNILIGYQVYNHSIPGQSGRALLNSRARKSSVTTMLIVVSMAFIVTTLPINIFFLTKYVTTVTDVDQIIIYSVFSLLYYTNNAINFFLYFVSGSRFRKAAKEFLMQCNKSAIKKPFYKTTSMTAPSVHMLHTATMAPSKMSRCDSK